MRVQTLQRKNFNCYLFWGLIKESPPNCWTTWNFFACTITSLLCCLRGLSIMLLATYAQFKNGSTSKRQAYSRLLSWKIEKLPTTPCRLMKLSQAYARWLPNALGVYLKGTEAFATSCWPKTTMNSRKLKMWVILNKMPWLAASKAKLL